MYTEVTSYFVHLFFFLWYFCQTRVCSFVSEQTAGTSVSFHVRAAASPDAFASSHLVIQSWLQTLLSTQMLTDSTERRKEAIFLDYFFEFQMLHPSGGCLMMIISLVSRLMSRLDKALSWKALNASQFLKACHRIAKQCFQINSDGALIKVWMSANQCAILFNVPLFPPWQINEVTFWQMETLPPAADGGSTCGV